jgi:hypothetical protein
VTLDGDPDGGGDTAAPAAAEVGGTPVNGTVVAGGDAVVGKALGVDCDTLDVDSVARGLRAIDPLDDAATTAMPSARSPAKARSGTRAKRLPSGKSSRQFGQKPETGVVM